MRLTPAPTHLFHARVLLALGGGRIIVSERFDRCYRIVRHTA
jgi:hypothetical protein